LIRYLPVPHSRTPHIGTKEAQPDALYPQPKTVTLAVPLPDAKLGSTESPPLPVDGSRPRDEQRSQRGCLGRESERVQHGALKPLSLDRFSVNFTADREFRELLEEVRALLSHSEPQGDLLSVMKRGLKALRTELLKKRFGVGRKLRRVRLGASVPREQSGSREPQAPKCTRHVPAAVTREVYARDQGRCTFCAEGGRRCEARRLLQLDHIIPYAEGGEHTVTNLRLRCRAHNLHTARAHFGKEHVRAATERARARTRCATSSRNDPPPTPLPDSAVRASGGAE
jgi:5-methylcytosine-specific restriction endonuclease McrA